MNNISIYLAYLPLGAIKKVTFLFLGGEECENIEKNADRAGGGMGNWTATVTRLKSDKSTITKTTGRKS